LVLCRKLIHSINWTTSGSKSINLIKNQSSHTCAGEVGRVSVNRPTEGYGGGKPPEERGSFRSFIAHATFNLSSNTFKIFPRKKVQNQPSDSNPNSVRSRRSSIHSDRYSYRSLYGDRTNGKDLFSHQVLDNRRFRGKLDYQYRLGSSVCSSRL